MDVPTMFIFNYLIRIAMILAHCQRLQNNDRRGNFKSIWQTQINLIKQILYRSF